MEREFITKFIDLTLPGAEYEINKHISFGWFIYYRGLTVIGLKKYI